MSTSNRDWDVAIDNIEHLFCVFFISARDHKRVLDMEPWVYWRSLILLAEILDDGSDTNLWGKNLLALWHAAPQHFPLLTQVMVTLHAMRVFGTRMGRVIRVVLNDDYVSSPTLTRYHQVLEAIESLRRQTGLSEDGVRSPPPPPLILYASELGILPMDIPQREVNLQETLATLGAHSVLQVEGITPKPLATSRDIMGPALFDLFDLMPIIQLVEGLQKKKARRTPKKREKARSVPVKNSVKRKPPEDVATGSDVMVRGMDSNGSKRFCSGTCFDKAKETGIVVSPGGPP
ncbi:hypothetical protein GBA52_024793 [Prunus armeniaca]|nr:hypothetical protein GBA52_024793 [Prunus armeniaca]